MGADERRVSAELERDVEALLFLCAEPGRRRARWPTRIGAELHEVVTALERLREHYEFERRGLVAARAGRRLGCPAIRTPSRRRGACWPGRARRR